MCNPRRVMIHLTRAVEEAWQQTVEQTAHLEGEARELARVSADIALDAEMGDLPLEMLERLLQGEFEGFEPWQRDDEGSYHRTLGEVTLQFNPRTRRLTVEAALTETISAEARAAAQASGFTVGEVAVEAVGTYFSDGWGGRTEETARRSATADAQRKLDEAVQALHREQHAAEFATAQAEANAQAQRLAAVELEKSRQQVRQTLRDRLRDTLARAEDSVRYTMNRLVGEAYRQSLLQLVRENGGRVVYQENTGSVIHLELEMN